jgi:hypothetical protein
VVVAILVKWTSTKTTLPSGNGRNGSKAKKHDSDDSTEVLTQRHLRL